MEYYKEKNLFSQNNQNNKESPLKRTNLLSKSEKIKRETIGFDVDGVIANSPYNLPNSLMTSKLTSKINNIAKKSYLGKKIINHLYQKRTPNKPIIELISDLKKNYKIVLITAYKNKKEAEKWLKKNNVEYDQLHIWNGDKSIKEYKSEKVEELGVEIFIDDSKEIINTLPKEIRGFRYNHKKSEEIIDEIKSLLKQKEGL